jgi:hypothetical protein
MSQHSIERLKTWLSDQGLSEDDAAWLAGLYLKVSHRLALRLGLGVDQEDGRTFVYWHVPDQQTGLRLDLRAVRRMVDPVAEIADLIRKTCH